MYLWRRIEQLLHRLSIESVTARLRFTSIASLQVAQSRTIFVIVFYGILVDYIPMDDIFTLMSLHWIAFFIDAIFDSSATEVI